jgi:predicted RNA-binding Zn-ribbon protein involved in translation (DUF1610 family)
MTNWMENVNNFQSMMMRDVFLDTLWATGTYILALLTLVATKFVVVYMRGNRPKVILPKNSTTTRTAVIAPINRVDIDRRMDELEGALLAPPVPFEPVAKPIQPVKVQPIKSREIKPTREVIAVAEAPVIECAKCGKQIKSPPIQRKGESVQYKCEHCGTNVALA